MTPLPPPPVHTGLLVRWQFTKGEDALSCGVHTNKSGAFDVVVSGGRPADRRAVEQYDGASNALMRHAFIASALRESGWRLAGYTG